MIAQAATEFTSWVLLVSTSGGACALVVVFYMLVKVMPEQMKAQQVAQEKANDTFLIALKDSIKEFRQEMAVERETNTKERNDDRLSRHEGNNAISGIVMAMTQALTLVQERAHMRERKDQDGR